MLEQLNKLVDHLNSVAGRAAKFRNKSGRIEISRDEWNELAVVLDEPRVSHSKKLGMDEYVAAIDQYIETVIAGLSFEQVEAADISEET